MEQCQDEVRIVVLCDRVDAGRIVAAIRASADCLPVQVHTQGLTPEPVALGRVIAIERCDVRNGTPLPAVLNRTIADDTRIW